MCKKSHEIENHLNLLKTFSLLKKIGNRDVTTSVILDVIEELNSAAEEKFGVWVEVKKYRAQDPNKLPNNWGYAEHPHLSLMQAGGAVQAFDLAGIDIPTLSVPTINYVVELCFACMEFGEYPNPKLNKKQKGIWKKLAASPTVQQTRDRIAGGARRHAIASNGLSAVPQGTPTGQAMMPKTQQK